jgi:hypothetical protein
MVEDHLIACAEIVESELSIRGRDEAIFGALAVADEQHSEFPAIAGQSILLIPAESSLLFRGHKLDHGRFQDVSQEVRRTDSSSSIT